MQISRHMVSSILLTVLLVMVTVATPGAWAAAHKRSCEHFCKHTGLSGIVGGCRCSLTLFTKRALAPSLDIDGAEILEVANEPAVVRAQAIKRAPHNEVEQLMNNDNDDTLHYTMLGF
ncbi:unnamed protein product [Meganyctiphanes norvegica]|uniref:Secreted protein n=1 Tax=Meganyctiphanes norvegica TaxID=48144 RepID=A0AAV2QYE5_MEGNR